ncbi:MAG: hypothetical protein JWO22_3601 [Frankiales bacterium]|nr:hypothetical protein [Frankiales bacterium]
MVVGSAAVLVILGAGAFLGIRAAIPPHPSLPYPAGQSLEHVRSNCNTGNELIGCDSLTGPRSFLQVKAGGDVRSAGDALFASMKSDGWREKPGLVAADFSAGGASEDIEPVLCKTARGCVGIFRYETDSYVLAWWEAPPGDGE